MEYMSSRKLVEMENEQGYWIKDSKVWSVTGSHHVEFVMEHPEYFDLTLPEIMDMFRTNNETFEHDLVTRDQLIQLACSQGWVRVRHYLDPAGYWSFMCDYIKLREKNIREFIEDFAFKNRLMAYGAKLIIIGLSSNDEMDIYKPNEGGATAFLRKVGFEEGSEVKLGDLIREYK